MTPEEITWLGEVAAKAAFRANSNGDRAGQDQNRGQFVAMVKGSLESIPVELRGDYARDFLDRYANSAYPQN
ncbi:MULTISPECIES: hypothetical protein [Delftia]|jgi:hypothetical protein|uniref:Uncharacterized protein n=2 Tax=cellular organisms TaxID=131567 RepID=A0A4Q2VFV0_FUSOX|nr:MULTISPECIES: hypothetical protein [Delftia]RYC83153.1 hypothetical protein BFJ63_vAg13985 [Fusarium oxysporum f. sp. narcissi]